MAAALTAFGLCAAMLILVGVVTWSSPAAAALGAPYHPILRVAAFLALATAVFRTFARRGMSSASCGGALTGARLEGLAPRFILLAAWLTFVIPDRSRWLATIIFAAFAEELIFRRRLPDAVEACWHPCPGNHRGRICAMLLSQGTFAASHMFRGSAEFSVDVTLALCRLVAAGIALLALTRLVGLWVAVVVHAAWNSVILLRPPGEDASAWWTLTSLLAGCAGALLLGRARPHEARTQPW